MEVKKGVRVLLNLKEEVMMIKVVKIKEKVVKMLRINSLSMVR